MEFVDACQSVWLALFGQHLVDIAAAMDGTCQHAWRTVDGALCILAIYSCASNPRLRGMKQLLAASVVLRRTYHKLSCVVVRCVGSQLQSNDHNRSMIQGAFLDNTTMYSFYMSIVSALFCCTPASASLSTAPPISSELLTAAITNVAHLQSIIRYDITNHSSTIDIETLCLICMSGCLQSQSISRTTPLELLQAIPYTTAQLVLAYEHQLLTEDKVLQAVSTLCSLVPFAPVVISACVTLELRAAAYSNVAMVKRIVSLCTTNELFHIEVCVCVCVCVKYNL
jgi:hypothetical protein